MGALPLSQTETTLNGTRGATQCTLTQNAKKRSTKEPATPTAAATGVSAIGVLAATLKAPATTATPTTCTPRTAITGTAFVRRGTSIFVMQTQGTATLAVVTEYSQAVATLKCGSVDRAG